MVTRRPALDEDDRCLGCRQPVEHHYDCAVETWTCSPCPHPACHHVVGVRINLGPLQKLRPKCRTCGLSGTETDDEGVKEWRAKHKTEVAG